ncbi:MAG: hypothetical protein IJU87_04270 [Lachnospiraceae bacterium]|nr:hypothetical protein [Lachnospiraceae bacterium]
MALSPIVFNGTINASQNIAELRTNEDGKVNIMQGEAAQRNEEDTTDKLSRVREADDANNDQRKFDSSEKGDNEYSGDGGRQRKRKDKDGTVFIKSKGGFDITI